MADLPVEAGGAECLLADEAGLCIVGTEDGSATVADDAMFDAESVSTDAASGFMRGAEGDPAFRARGEIMLAEASFAAGKGASDRVGTAGLLATADAGGGAGPAEKASADPAGATVAGAEVLVARGASFETAVAVLLVTDVASLRMDDADIVSAGGAAPVTSETDGIPADLAGGGMIVTAPFPARSAQGNAGGTEGLVAVGTLLEGASLAEILSASGALLHTLGTGDMMLGAEGDAPERAFTDRAWGDDRLSVV